MIDIARLPEDQVYTLYQITKARFEKISEELAKDSEGTANLNPELGNEFHNVKSDLDTLYRYFQDKRNQKIGWSLVDLYNLGPNKFISVKFYPSSDAYQKFGDSVSGSMVQSSEFMTREFIEAKNNGVKLEGVLCFNADESDFHSDEQKLQLKNLGFHCRDIYSVEGFGL